MSTLSIHTVATANGDVLDIAPNVIVAPQVLRSGTLTVVLIVGLFLVSAALVASTMLGLAMLAIGTFVAFSMMMMIGMPLILACVEDAISAEPH